jgi:dATP pyrophosphohydrolase
MRLPVQVAVYCVRQRNSDWEYLLLRRIPSSGRHWQGITGGVEEGEDYYAAARRELREETGFVPAKIERVDFSYTFPVDDQMLRLYEKPVDSITEIVFLAHIDGLREPKLDPREHDAWEWCSYEKAFELLYWDGNKESLKHCEQYLRSRR